MFYQGGTINSCTNVPGPVDQYSANSEYNTVWTAGMALSNFKMLNNELLNEDPYVVPKKALLIILDGKSTICMAKNEKDTRNISRRMHLVRNG